MSQKKEAVALVKCRTYSQKEVDKAVKKALNLIDFKFKKGMKVLIKPNTVGLFKQNQTAITTNVSLIEAVCKILKQYNAKIFIGDSSFTDPECVMKKTGIEKVANKYGKLVIFDLQKLVKVKDKSARILKSFHIPKIIKQVDLIINMPKLKTHQLTKYTGAIKNLYGCIPGGMKQKLHAKARGEKNFSALLVDLYQNIKPELNIMDGVIGMEGDGPTSGEPRKVGLIIASKNAIALDIMVAKMIGYKLKKIYYLKEAIKRKLFREKIEVVGENLPKLKFKKPKKDKKFRRSFAGLIKNRPIVCDENKCIKCGTCAKHCPMKAITLNPYPVIDKKKCIRCFCCIEICPENALSLR